MPPHAPSHSPLLLDIEESDDSLSRTVPDARKSDPDRRRRPSVRFASVEVREFVRVLGDHPDTCEGLSLAIGWEYVTALRPVPVDLFESTRAPRRRPKSELIMTPEKKRKMMRREFGYSREEIERAERRVERRMRQKERRERMGLLAKGAEDAIRQTAARIRRISLVAKASTK